MELIRIISDVGDDGKIHIPEKLTLKKGKVELIIKSLDENNEVKDLSYSNHSCGRIIT